MECKIYRCGKAIGTLHIEEDGLYRVLFAQIPMSGDMLRLYLPAFGRAGIFVPSGTVLEYRRRISRTRLPKLPETAYAWCERDSLWTQEADGIRRRYHPLAVELAVRWQQEEPMIFPAAPQQLRPITIEGQLYLSCERPFSDHERIRRMV